MANRTIKDAKTIHGSNPQNLIEKIIRTRIYESVYWKEDCFGLSAELLVDKAVELRYIGGIYGGNIKPTPFLCLTLKLLQIQPEKDIVIEFIRQEDFKYVRALGAFYLRLTGTSIEIWKYLEPLYNDYRKLRRMDRMGKCSVIHMDEFVDLLLRDDRVFDVILPRLLKRHVHEESGDLEQRISLLEDIDDVDDDENDNEEIIEEDNRKKPLEQRNYNWTKNRPRNRVAEVKEPESSKATSRARRKSRSKSPTTKRRSRSKERRRRERSRSRDRRRRSSSPKREKERKSGSASDKKRKDETKTLDEEIREQNELRAKLGLAPLRK